MPEGVRAFPPNTAAPNHARVVEEPPSFVRRNTKSKTAGRGSGMSATCSFTHPSEDTLYINCWPNCWPSLPHFQRFRGSASEQRQPTDRVYNSNGLPITRPPTVYLSRGFERSTLHVASNGPHITRLRTVYQSREATAYLICKAVAMKMPRVPPQTSTSNVGGFSAPNGVSLSVTNVGGGPASSPVFMFRNAVHPASARTRPCSQNRIARVSKQEVC